MNRRIKFSIIYAIVFSILFLSFGLIIGTNFSIIVGAIAGFIFGAIIGFSMSTIVSNKEAMAMMRMDKNSLNEIGILTALVSAAIFWQIARYLVGDNSIIKVMALIAGWYVGSKLAKAVRKIVKKK